MDTVLVILVFVNIVIIAVDMRKRASLERRVNQLASITNGMQAPLNTVAQRFESENREAGLKWHAVPLSLIEKSGGKGDIA